MTKWANISYCSMQLYLASAFSWVCLSSWSLLRSLTSSSTLPVDEEFLSTERLAARPSLLLLLLVFSCCSRARLMSCWLTMTDTLLFLPSADVLWILCLFKRDTTCFLVFRSSAAFLFSIVALRLRSPFWLFEMTWRRVTWRPFFVLSRLLRQYWK